MSNRIDKYSTHNWQISFASFIYSFLQASSCNCWSKGVCNRFEVPVSKTYFPFHVQCLAQGDQGEELLTIRLC